MENHLFQWENPLFLSISMAIFNSFLYVYQRVLQIITSHERLPFEKAKWDGIQGLRISWLGRLYRLPDSGTTRNSENLRSIKGEDKSL